MNYYPNIGGCKDDKTLLSEVCLSAPHLNKYGYCVIDVRVNRRIDWSLIRLIQNEILYQQRINK